MIERGPGDLFAVESDRLSIVHVLLFALIAGFWSIIAWAEAGAGRSAPAHATATTSRHPGPLLSSWLPTRQAMRRMLVALVGMAAIAVIMLLCFPDLRQGPLGQVDPLYARIRLQNIIEIQPLVPPEWLTSGRVGEALGRLIRVVGIALFALPCLGILLVRRSGPAWRFWATVALALLVFVPLAFYQMRWATYAEAFLVWPYAAGVGWLLGRVSAAAAARAGVLLRPLVILGRPVLAAPGRGRPAPAGDRERRPRLPARSPGGGPQSRRADAAAPSSPTPTMAPSSSIARTIACSRSPIIDRSRDSPRPTGS